MPKRNTEIKTEEQLAFDKYIAERSKISDVLYSKANKQSLHKNALTWLAGGAATVTVLGVLLLPTMTQKPVRNESGRVVEYKTDFKLLTKSMLYAIALIMVAAIAFAGVKTQIDARLNRIWSNTLAHELLKKIFKEPLASFVKDENLLSRNICATALILNNMPESKLADIRELAMNCFTNSSEDITEWSLSPDNENIQEISSIISNYIMANPELGYNIIRIMRGNEPTTYFLPNLMQKTK